MNGLLQTWNLKYGVEALHYFIISYMCVWVKYINCKAVIVHESDIFTYVKLPISTDI